MWLSGRAFALHVKGPGFDPRHLHSHFFFLFGKRSIFCRWYICKQTRICDNGHGVKPNVLFLTSDNEFSGIIYSLCRGRQNIFLRIFSTKFVVKCTTKILRLGRQKQKVRPKIF